MKASPKGSGKPSSALTCEIFHEIKNKLIPASTFFQLLPEKYDDKDFVMKFSKLALKELKEIQHHIDRFLKNKPSSLFLSPTPSHSTLFLPILENCLNLLELDLKKETIQVSIQPSLSRPLPSENSFKLPFKKEILKEILFNLLLNALQALVETKGKRVITLGRLNQKQKQGFFVKDSGKGINKKDLKKIFDPFFTTKSRGSGLGLPIVKRLIESSGGGIHIESQTGKGSKVSVTFPQTKL